MAIVSIEIPNTAINRVKLVVQLHGPMLVPNSVPADKQPEDWTNAEALAVLKEMLRHYVLDLVKQSEGAAAADAARSAIIAQIDADGIVV